MVQQATAPVSNKTLTTEGTRFELFKDPLSRFTLLGEVKATGELFVHCTPIHPWGKVAYLAVLEGLNIIRSAAQKQGYRTLYAFVDKRRLHFAAAMGFCPIHEYKDEVGHLFYLLELPTGEH